MQACQLQRLKDMIGARKRRGIPARSPQGRKLAAMERLCDEMETLYREESDPRLEEEQDPNDNDYDWWDFPGSTCGDRS